MNPSAFLACLLHLASLVGFLQSVWMVWRWLDLLLDGFRAFLTKNKSSELRASELLVSLVKSMSTAIKAAHYGQSIIFAASTREETNAFSSKQNMWIEPIKMTAGSFFRAENTAGSNCFPSLRLMLAVHWHLSASLGLYAQTSVFVTLNSCQIFSVCGHNLALSSQSGTWLAARWQVISTVWRSLLEVKNRHC